MRALKAETAVEAKSAPTGAGVVIVPTASAVTDEIVSLLREFVRRLAKCRRSWRRRRRSRAASTSAFPRAAGSRFCAASPTPSARSSTALESQRHELEQFLEQVTQQLADFEDWTRWQAGAAQSRRDDTHGLEPPCKPRSCI